jgi:hypothetical protein
MNVCLCRYTIIIIIIIVFKVGEPFEATKRMALEEVTMYGISQEERFHLPYRIEVSWNIPNLNPVLIGQASPFLINA